MQAVYQITVGDLIYIGASINVKERIRVHKQSLFLGTHPNHFLQEVWNEYGIGEFKFTILQEVLRQEHLHALEAMYVDRFDTCNIHTDPEDQYFADLLATRNPGDPGYRAMGVKLTRDQYQHIFDDMLGDETNKYIAAKWGLTRAAMAKLASGETHEWLAENKDYSLMLAKRKIVQHLSRRDELHLLRECNALTTAPARPPKYKNYLDYTRVKDQLTQLQFRKPSLVVPPMSVSTAPTMPVQEIELLFRNGDVAAMTYDEWLEWGMPKIYFDELLKDKRISVRGFKFIKKIVANREIILYKRGL